MAGANKARNKDAGTRSKRRPRTVPVASRAHTQGGKPAGKGKSPAKGASPKPPRQRGRVDLLGYAIILFVLLAILWAVATPLRNYYSGRAEIAADLNATPKNNSYLATLSGKAERLATGTPARTRAAASAKRRCSHRRKPSL